MSQVDISSNFSINDISVANLKDIKITDVSDGLTYGRRFTLDIEGQDLHSDPLVFKEIISKVKDLARSERRNGTIENLTTIYTFLEELKEVDETANAKYKARAKNDMAYRIRTWFHRLGDFGKTHAEKIDAEIAIIDNMHLGIADTYNRRKLAQSLVHQDPAHAEQALFHLNLQPEERESSLKDILEVYFGKGDSISLKAAYEVINQLDADERFNPTIRVVNALVEQKNPEDTLFAADIMRNHSWKLGEHYDEFKEAASKVCDAMIGMAESSDPSGLETAKRIALRGGLNTQFERIYELQNAGA